MSMTIREVINALMDAKDIDKECIIEVNRNIFNNTDDDWVEVNIDEVVNCACGSVIAGKKVNAE